MRARSVYLDKAPGMISNLLVCTVLSLSWPDDIIELPMLEVATPPPCDGDRDCFSAYAPLCDTNTGQCVECLGPEHCAEGWTCQLGSCMDACRVDADCEGINGESRCDPEQGICVECLSVDDCAPEQYCAAGQYCRDDHCIPGMEFCFGDTIMLCLEDGGSTMEIQECEECDELEGGAQCVAPSVDSGDSGSGDASGTTAGSAGSAGEGTSAETSPAGPEIHGEGCTCTTGPRGGGIGLMLLGLLRRRRSSRPGRGSSPV